jgi:hypothetical protein
MGSVDRLVSQRRLDTEENEILICAHGLSRIQQESQPSSAKGAVYCAMLSLFINEGQHKDHEAPTRLWFFSVACLSRLGDARVGVTESEGL